MSLHIYNFTLKKKPKREIKINTHIHYTCLLAINEKLQNNRYVQIIFFRTVILVALMFSIGQRLKTKKWG